MQRVVKQKHDAAATSRARTSRILERIEAMGFAVETDSAEGIVCMAAIDGEGTHHVVTATNTAAAAIQLIEHLGLD